jgi:tetratricopeptide (TPR) repeat protein
MENLKKKIQIALEAYKSGDLLVAEKLSKKLILSNPKVVFLYNLLGLISADLNKIDQSLKYYEDGVKIDSNDPYLYNNIAVLLFNNMYKNNIKKIEFNYKKSISLNNNNPEAYNNLANFYKFLNRNDEASQNYKKAIEINPKFHFALFNLASLYVSCGKINEAKEKLTEVLLIEPNYMHAHRLLSRITNYNKENNHLKVLNKLYSQMEKKNDYNKMLISYSLAKANEDIKDYDKSFMHYKVANKISRKNINFSIEEEKIKFDKIKEAFTTDTFNIYKDSGCKDYTPIFIVGMPRSGTTLVEQIFSSHPDVFGCDEVEFVPEIINKNFGNYKSFSSSFLLSLNSNPKEFKKMAENYMVKVNELSNFSKRTTDKLPTNFLYIGFIKLMLPNAKLVHCYRNSKDNCMSIYKNNFTSGKVNFSHNLNEIIEYYNLYNDLMNYWKDLIPDFIYHIKYEDVVNDTEIQIKKLLKNCDLKWNDNCLNFDQNKRPIKTASDVQVRKKIYKSSVNSWKNYEKFVSNSFLGLKN